MSRSSDPTKPAEWRGRFERFFDSGLAVAPFCTREGVSVASFYLWRKKLGANGRRSLGPLLGQKGRRRRRRPSMTAGLRRDGAGSTDERGVFQQVALIPAASGMISTARAVSIQLPCGTRIEVDAAHLDALSVAIAEVLRSDRSVTAVPASGARGAGAA